MSHRASACAIRTKSLAENNKKLLGPTLTLQIGAVLSIAASSPDEAAVFVTTDSARGSNYDE
jgi:hypothetical protein